MIPDLTSPGTTQLNWALIGIFTAAAITGSLLGGRLSTRANPEHLTRAFATLLIAVALYTAARSLPTLLWFPHQAGSAIPKPAHPRRAHDIRYPQARRPSITEPQRCWWWIVAEKWLS